MYFALTNTSPRISEGRVPMISGRAEGQWRGQRNGGVRGKYSMQYSN